MTWQTAKAGFSLSTGQIAWRRLAKVIALTLLLTQQAWAGLICHCQQQNDDAAQMSHACCSTSHHCPFAQAAESARESADSDNSGAEEAGPDDALLTPAKACGAAQPLITICCQDTPQTEQQALTSTQGPVSVAHHQSLISSGWQTNQNSTFYNQQQPTHTRPLYLSLSCFLI